MPFEKLAHSYDRQTSIRNVRFSVEVSKAAKTGRLAIPPAILKELGWTDGTKLDVHRGTGEDEGWFAMTVAAGETKGRGALHVGSTEVGRFNSALLVPPNVEESISSFEPPVRVQDGWLYVKAY